MFAHLKDGEFRSEEAAAHPFRCTRLFGTLFADLFPEAILVASCSLTTCSSLGGAAAASLVHPWVHPLSDGATAGPGSDGR